MEFLTTWNDYIKWNKRGAMPELPELSSGHQPKIIVWAIGVNRRYLGVVSEIRSTDWWPTLR